MVINALQKKMRGLDVTWRVLDGEEGFDRIRYLEELFRSVQPEPKNVKRGILGALGDFRQYKIIEDDVTITLQRQRSLYFVGLDYPSYHYSLTVQRNGFRIGRATGKRIKKLYGSMQ